MNDTGFMSPFRDVWTDTALTMLGDLPVLDRTATGTEFVEGYDTGSEWTDFGGVVEVRNRWSHSAMVFPRSYLCQRVLNLADWVWWRTFADWCKGSLNPFYVSTARQDFAVHTAPIPNGVSVILEGTSYLDEYWPIPAMRQIAIATELGTHYAKVTGANFAGGHSQLTFAPALPNVAGWANDQKISLLLKARIADDAVTLTHNGLDTTIDLSLRTCDQ